MEYAEEPKRAFTIPSGQYPKCERTNKFHLEERQRNNFLRRMLGFC